MVKYLMILEVSQKQAYIFAAKKLKENAARSQDINTVTSSKFFARMAGELYQEGNNLVYAGGGHTVLQFDSQEQAVAFAKVITEMVLRQYPGLELFVKTIEYNPAKTPGDNLKELSKALEAKKARRLASFRLIDFGLEQPLEYGGIKLNGSGGEGVLPPEGYRFPSQFEELVNALPGETADNFIAVIHIDGNAMGARVDNIFRASTGDWEHCRTSLRRFSEGIQADFEAAFQATVDEVIRILQPRRDLPIRPVIMAGDDVCFVTAGNIGLECARLFIEKLKAKPNGVDHKPYAACTGVALVHLKYPFHRAYDLAEELCNNAKRFGAGLDSQGRVSAMDWHIEFGQLKDSLSELRRDYRTEDGCRLELRPMTVQVPEGVQKPAPERTYDFFRTLCGAMEDRRGEIARSKIKELRTALKQGEVEGEFFLQDKEIDELLYAPLQAAYPLRDWPEELKRKGAFRVFAEKNGEEKRCLFFDAIELLDHYQMMGEVSR